MDMTIHLIKRTKSQRKTFFGIIQKRGMKRGDLKRGNLRTGDVPIRD